MQLLAVTNVNRIIDHRLYPRKALSAAREAYSEYCEFNIKPLSHNRASVTIQVKEKYSADSRQVILEFFNYALDSAAQIKFEE